MKKLLIISSGLLFVVILFFGIYNFAFKAKTNITPLGKSEDEIERLKTGEKKQEQQIQVNPLKKGRIYAISQGPVVSAILNEGKDGIVYYEKSGNTFELSIDDETISTVSRDTLDGLVNIFWSPSGNKVVSQLRGSDGDHFYLYDFDTRQGERLKSGLDSVAWSNPGNKIIYKFFDSQTGKRSLNVADPNGTNWKKLADIEFRNLSIAAIPQSSVVSFWNSPDVEQETQLKTISLVGGDPKAIFSGKYGADYGWSPSGDKLLASYVAGKDGKGLTLALMDRDGKNFQDLKIPTFVSKVAWSADGKTLYYALPGDISGGGGAMNSYIRGESNTKDTFWKVDLEDGKKNRLIELGDINQEVDAVSLIVAPSREAIFFINRIDGKLYKLSL